jgi:hypothetical protein
VGGTCHSIKIRASQVCCEKHGYAAREGKFLREKERERERKGERHREREGV